MPWPVPSARTIFDRLAANHEQNLSEARPDIDPLAISRAARSNHGLLSIISRTIALELREIHDHVAFYGRQYFPDTAEEDYVLRHGAIWGVERRDASFAQGVVLIEGTANKVLPADIELSNSAGLIFQTKQSFTLSSEGIATVSVIAKASGPTSNLSTQDSLNTVEAYPDIKKISVVTGFMGGAAQETWQDYRSRILARIRQPPHGGSGFDYIEWLSSKFDVRAVSVVPDWIGRGSVGLVVVMRDGANGRPPSELEIEQMLDYLGRPNSSTGVRPVTAHVIIVAAVPKIIDLKIRIRPDTVATRFAIQEAFNAFLLSLGDSNDDYNTSPIGATIEVSRLIEALSAATNEYAHDLIEPSKNIELERTQYAIAGTITFMDKLP